MFNWLVRLFQSGMSNASRSPEVLIEKKISQQEEARIEALKKLDNPETAAMVRWLLDHRPTHSALGSGTATAEILSSIVTGKAPEPAFRRFQCNTEPFDANEAIEELFGSPAWDANNYADVDQSRKPDPVFRADSVFDEEKLRFIWLSVPISQSGKVWHSIGIRIGPIGTAIPSMLAIQLSYVGDETVDNVIFLSRRKIEAFSGGVYTFNTHGIDASKPARLLVCGGSPFYVTEFSPVFSGDSVLYKLQYPGEIAWPVEKQ